MAPYLQILVLKFYISSQGPKIPHLIYPVLLPTPPNSLH